MSHLSSSKSKSPSVGTGLSTLLNELNLHINKHMLQSNPLLGFDKLETLCEQTELPKEEVALIAIIRGMGGRFFQADQTSIEQIARNIFEGQFGLLRASLQELMYKKVVEFDHQEKSNIKIALTEKAEDAIVSNNAGFFSGKVPSGLDYLLNTFKEEFMHYEPVRRERFYKTYESLMKSNANLALVQYLENEKNTMSMVDRFVLLSTVTSHTMYSRPFDLDYVQQFLRFDSVYAMMLQLSIANQTWDPINDGYVAVAGGGMMENDFDLELTEKGVDFFLGELDPKLLSQMKMRSLKKLNIIQPDSIEPVPLILTDKLQEQYNRLHWLLSDDHIDEYSNMLESGERMRGVSALMYGAPGTGKTQMVYNLAKESNRGLVELNIDMILSKWFGESQYKLREFFNGYRSVVKRSERAPILFLNEADQIFMRRLSVGDSIDQTLNNLQNIVLTEMEQFPEGGILLATTNLVENFDPATERRILLKLKFEKPSLEVRKEVWKTIIPELTQEETELAASEFDFAPGEIRNISKKFKLEKLLSHGKMEPIEIIRKLAEDERYSQSQQKQTIGF